MKVSSGTFVHTGIYRETVRPSNSAIDKYLPEQIIWIVRKRTGICTDSSV